VRRQHPERCHQNPLGLFLPPSSLWQSTVIICFSTGSSHAA
jgi:hypothetical protein